MLLYALDRPPSGRAAYGAWHVRGFGDFWAHMLVAEGAAELAVDAADLAVWDIGAIRVVVEEDRRPLRRPRVSSNGGSTSPGCADRRLVDRVAAEHVQLVGQQVARRRRRRRAARPRSPSTATPRSVFAARCASSTSAAAASAASRRAAAHPPPAPSPAALHAPDPGPELRRAAAASRACAPRRCPRPRPGRTARPAARRQPAVPPFRRVDDEPVDHADELRQLAGLPARLAAPAAEHRQVGDEERHARSTRAPSRGRPSASARPPPTRSRGRSPSTRECARRRRRRCRPRRGAGVSRIVRDGCRSASPASVRSAAFEPLRRRPDEVRHHARPLDALVAAPRSARARRRRASCPSVPSPRAPVTVDQLVRARRAPRAGLVVREHRPVALPRGDDRVDERPLLARPRPRA